MSEHAIANVNSIVQHVIQKKNEIIKHASVNVKIIQKKCKKDYSWNPSTCICENNKYLESNPDTSVTKCDKIIIAMDNVSTKKSNTIATKKINTIATDVMSTVSINCHGKKVSDCYILHSVLLVIILLFIITTICCHYAKQKGII